MFEMQSVLQRPASSKRQVAAMAALLHLSVATVLVVGLAWRIEAVEAPTFSGTFLPIAFLPAEWSAPLVKPAAVAVAAPVAKAPTVAQPEEVTDASPATASALAAEPIATLGDPNAVSAAPGDSSALTDPGGIGGGQGVPAPAATVVWQPGTGIVPPQVLFRLDPKYPELARSVRREGAVVIEAEIATDGSLRSARVVSSPLGFGLEQSALDAIRAWRFAPARFGDRPVSVYYRWNVLFSLR